MSTIEIEINGVYSCAVVDSEIEKSVVSILYLQLLREIFGVHFEIYEFREKFHCKCEILVRNIKKKWTFQVIFIETPIIFLAKDWIKAMNVEYSLSRKSIRFIWKNKRFQMPLREINYWEEFVQALVERVLRKREEFLQINNNEEEDIIQPSMSIPEETLEKEDKESDILEEAMLLFSEFDKEFTKETEKIAHKSIDNLYEEIFQMYEEIMSKTSSSEISEASDIIPDEEDDEDIFYDAQEYLEEEFSTSLFTNDLIEDNTIEEEEEELTEEQTNNFENIIVGNSNNSFQ